MSTKKTDGNLYTIIFAIIMVIVVGALLAFVASSLSDKIAKNKEIEAQQNILYAMGVNDNEGEGDVTFVPAEKVQDAFASHIKKQYVLQGKSIEEDPKAYLIDLAKEEQLAKSDDYEPRLPLFLGEKDGETFYIIPMRGKGLWDAIWGFMAVGKDLRVKGAFFDHKGETPGLGANIKERYFMDDFAGEALIGDNGNFKGITVAKGNMDPTNEDKDDHEVDALAGATITGDGVSAMIQSTMKMYIPYLEKLNKE